MAALLYYLKLPLGMEITKDLVQECVNGNTSMGGCLHVVVLISLGILLFLDLVVLSNDLGKMIGR